MPWWEENSKQGPSTGWMWRWTDMTRTPWMTSRRCTGWACSSSSTPCTGLFMTSRGQDGLSRYIKRSGKYFSPVLKAMKMDGYTFGVQILPDQMQVMVIPSLRYLPLSIRLGCQSCPHSAIDPSLWPSHLPTAWFVIQIACSATGALAHVRDGQRGKGL